LQCCQRTFQAGLTQSICWKQA
jgi:nucleoside diphosphate kinase